MMRAGPQSCIFYTILMDKNIPPEAKIYYGQINNWIYSDRTDEELSEWTGVPLKKVIKFHKLLIKHEYMGFVYEGSRRLIDILPKGHC